MLFDFKLVAGLAASMLVVTLASGTFAQAEVPTENVGVVAEVLGEIDLSAEFAEVGTRKLRMRTITVAPGGIIGLHNHMNRPSVEYVLSGTGTEVRGDETVTLMPNDKIVADHTTEHYWRNEGSEPLVLLAVDIFEPQ